MGHSLLDVVRDMVDLPFQVPHAISAAKELALSHDETVRSLKPIFLDLVTVLKEIKIVLQKSQEDAARHSKEAAIATTEAHADARAASDILSLKNSEDLAGVVATALREYAEKRKL